MHPRRNIDRMHRRQQAGLCTRCANGVLATSRWLCEACKALRRAADKQLTAMRHKRGLSKRGRPLSAGWLAHLMLLLAVPAFAHDAPQDIATEHVTLIETSHVHCDQTGRLTLTQNIFLDAYPALDGAKQVIAWRMANEGPRPEYDWQRRCWTMTWLDSGILRRVTADSWLESVELYDPEIASREVWPREKRRELLAPSGPASGR